MERERDGERHATRIVKHEKKIAEALIASK